LIHDLLVANPTPAWHLSRIVGVGSPAVHQAGWGRITSTLCP
jgi:hypothetical protein